MLVVLGLPLLIPLLGISPTQYGIIAGLTVYAVPQVLAATAPVGLVSSQIGTLVKLVRVLTLGPILLGFSLFGRKLRETADGAVASTRVRPLQVVPWFVVGFVVLAVHAVVRDPAGRVGRAAAEGRVAIDPDLDGRARTWRRRSRDRTGGSDG